MTPVDIMRGIAIINDFTIPGSLIILLGKWELMQAGVPACRYDPINSPSL